MNQQHTPKHKPNTKYKTLVSLFVFCGTIIVLCFLGYKVLNEGIYKQELSFGFVKIEGLYLKLENKFIVDIKKVDLSQSTLFSSETSNDTKQENLKDSIDSAMNWVQNIFWILSYFETLNIHKIIFPDNTERAILYDGSHYLITTPHFSAILNTTQSSKDISLEIQSLIIPELFLEATGYMQYHIGSKTLDISTLQISHTKTLNQANNEIASIYITGNTDFQNATLTINSSTWDQVQFLKPYIALLDNKTLESWLFKQIQFESIQLKNLTLKLSFHKYFVQNLLADMYGSIHLHKPTISIAPNTTPIIASDATINLANKALDIRFSEPSFAGHSLGTSAVQIHLPINQAFGVFVQLRSKDLVLDKTLLDLLYAILDIHLPVQTSSVLDTTLDLALKLNSKDQLETQVNGVISGKNVNAILFGQPILATDLQTTLNIDRDKKRLISIKSSQTKYADMLSTQVTFDIDALAQTLKGDFLIQYADLLPSKMFPAHVNYPGFKDIADDDVMTKNIINAIIKENTSTLPSILQIPPLSQNTESTQPNSSSNATQSNSIRNITLEGSFKDGIINLAIPQLTLSFKQDSMLHISLEKIQTLYPHSPLLQYFGVKKGSLTLHNKDANAGEVLLEAKIENLAYPVYDKNHQALHTLELNGSIQADDIMLTTKDQHIKFHKHLNTTSLVFKDYNLDINELMESKIPMLYEIFHEEGESVSYTPEEIAQKNAFIRQKRKFENKHNIAPHILYLESNNMDIVYGDFIIPTDSATITMRDKRINANAAYGNGIADINIAYGRANITLDNFSSSFINQVLSKQLFAGGLFDFSGTLKDNTLQGEIRIQNTTFKDFAIVQNIVGLIDTIPSLIMFKKPGLSNDGYEIKEGKFLFSMNNEYLGFESVDLTGSAIDINGNGIVNLKERTIDLLLKASTMKALSNIISNIPIVGYIILGDDGKVTTNIVVSGSLDNPKTEVSFIEDVVNAPFKILHRIFSPLDSIVDTLIEE